MKVVHIAYSFGRESAASRLILGLGSQGVEVSAIAEHGRGVNFELYSLRRSLWRKGIRKFFPALENVLGNMLEKVFFRSYPSRDTSLPWSPGVSKVSLTSRQLEDIRCDIAHIHWISNGFPGLKSLHRLNVPIVWTFHDVWPITAGCHCDLGCKKWLSGCLACPQLGNPALGIDWAHRIFLRKLKRIAKIKNLEIIAPSAWLGDMVEKSPMFAGRKVHVIHNCIDLKAFKPWEKLKARELLGLDPTKKIVIFGASGGHLVAYKGFDLLVDALNLFYARLRREGKNASAYQLLVFGSSQAVEVNLPFDLVSVGVIDDDVHMRALYSAADVLVAPSRQDNFPNILVEAMACGLPVVAFSIGGITEIVEHRRNGYLAKPFSVEDLCEGIGYIIDDLDRSDSLRQSARAWAEKNVSYSSVCEKHEAVYRSVIEKGRRTS